MMRLFSNNLTRSSRRGFTLMETSLATIIIGIGVTAIVQLLAKGTISNMNGADLTTAVNLANNIHELTYGLTMVDPNNPTNWGAETGETLATYSHLDCFNDKTFSPPIDTRRQALSSYTNWSQSISVQKVDINRVATTVPSNTSTPSARVIVSVSHLGQVVYSETWLVTDGQ
jgi:prepilin-type N-terminal cleavage/methylation domain-containing protein